MDDLLHGTSNMVAGMRVFISHASEDRSVAESIVGALEAAAMPCWIAPRDIVPGADWSEEIIKWLDESGLVVVVLSEHSLASKQVRREVSRASSRDLPIIPFRLADVRLTDSLEFFLESRHRLDAFTHPLDYHLRELVATAAGTLGKERPVVPEEPDARPGPDEPHIPPDGWARRPGRRRGKLGRFGSFFDDR